MCQVFVCLFCLPSLVSLLFKIIHCFWDYLCTLAHIISHNAGLLKTRIDRHLSTAVGGGEGVDNTKAQYDLLASNNLAEEQVS